MPGNSFLDTNLFIYSLDDLEIQKHLRANELIADLRVEGRGAISYQVIQEFANVLLRSRSGKTVPGLDEIFVDFEVVWPSIQFYANALRTQARYKFHWYDSLIVTAALEAGCTTLYTEDLQHGQQIDGLTVVNPFL